MIAAGRMHGIGLATLAGLLALAACGNDRSTPQPAVTDNPSTPTVETLDTIPQPEAPPAAPAAQPGAPRTELVPGERGRNTLIDRGLGVQISCPPDLTWRCTLGDDGAWSLRDMSSNTLTVREVTGAADLAAALQAEIAFARGQLPVTGVASQEGATAVLDVGPNPEWASPVNRKAWVQVRQVGSRTYACHGLGSDSNYESSRGDYEAMCGSLAAAP